MRRSRKRCIHTHAHYDMMWGNGKRGTVMGCYAIVKDDPYFGYGENWQIFSARCVECREWLPLGPANDAPDAVRCDNRASDIAACFGARMSDVESRGYGVHPFGDDHEGAHRAEAESLEWLSGWLASEIDEHDDRDRRDSAAWPWDPTRPVAGQYEEWLARGDAKVAAMDADAEAELEGSTAEPTCAACDTADGCEEHKLFTCSGCGKRVPWSDGGEDDVCSACWCAANGIVVEQTRHDVAASVARHAEIAEKIAATTEDEVTC